MQYWDALDLCADQHIAMTDSLVEQLSPAAAATDGMTDVERCRILEAVGEVCYSQDQYRLAAKKFTQAGNKVKVFHTIPSVSKCKHFTENHHNAIEWCPSLALSEKIQCLNYNA